MNFPKNPSAVLTLRANVSELDAFNEFQTIRLASLLWRFRNGPLQRIAKAYLPFAQYRLQYEIGRARHTRYFALDQVEGVLDLYEFPDAINSNELLPVETRNKIAPALSPDRTEFLLREKALRLIFQQGFFRLRQPKLQLECIHNRFYIPYWLGFYGEDGGLHCRVLDAVRRRMEGQKSTFLFERWLADSSQTWSQP
jgi:hypothetical protein